MTDSIWTEEVVKDIESKSEGKFLKLENGVVRHFRLLDLTRQKAEKPEFADKDGMQYVLKLHDLSRDTQKVWNTSGKRAVAALRTAGIDRGDEFSVLRTGEGFATDNTIEKLVDGIPKSMLAEPKTSEVTDNSTAFKDSDVPF